MKNAVITKLQAIIIAVIALIAAIAGGYAIYEYTGPKIVTIMLLL